MTLDLLDDAAFARDDVDARLAALRASSPVFWYAMPERGFWAVLRHADAARVLRDPATFSSARGTGHVSAYDGAAPPAHRSVNASDGALHGELRALVGEALASTTHRAWWQAHAARAVATWVDAGGGDAVALAEALTLDWLCRALGATTDERARLAAATRAIARHADPACRDAGQSARDALLAGERALFGLIFDWIRARRLEPRDDVLGRLVQRGDALDERDLAYAIRLVALTGHHSTAFAIAGGLDALATQPASAQLADGAPLAPAVDEVLRWTSPVIRFGRVATRAVQLGDRVIAAGARVVVVFRAANYDPEVFPDPMRCDLSRAPNPHVALGAGSHACLGGAAIREQVGAVLDAMRGVALARAGDPRRLASSVTSGFVALPLSARRR